MAEKKKHFNAKNTVALNRVAGIEKFFILPARPPSEEITPGKVVQLIFVIKWTYLQNNYAQRIYGRHK